MRVRTSLILLLALTMVLVSEVAFAKTVDTSVKGSEGTLYFDPPGPFCFKFCDTLRVKNSTRPAIEVTVFTKNNAGLIHESQSIPHGERRKFHAVGPGITDKYCVTETKSVSEVCGELIFHCAPTLSQWVLIVLALSVAGFFVWQLKRRRKTVISCQ